MTNPSNYLLVSYVYAIILISSFAESFVLPFQWASFARYFTLGLLLLL